MQRLASAKMMMGVAAVMLSAAAALGQQIPDPNPDVTITDPAFARGTGPIILVDSGHNENQTLARNYAAFGALLTNDGYVVSDFSAPFVTANLPKGAVLVIAEPLNPDDPKDAPKRDSTSAFTPREIAVIHDWVAGGGMLMMIADHPPYAGSLRALAASFGFTIDEYPAQITPLKEVFSTANGLLNPGPLTTGVDQVETFYGTAFSAPPGAMPLLHFGPPWTMLVTGQAPRTMTASDLRGAALTVGKGRVVMLAEAGAWSAQLAGKMKRQIGFDAPDATGNKRFLRNVVKWLATGQFPPASSTPVPKPQDDK